jgi:RHS repeat-associated protein
MAGKPVKMPRVIARVHYTFILLLAVLLAAFWPTVAGSNNSVADANRTALHTASQLKFGAKPAIVIFDGDGNVTALVDSAENIVGRYLYGPFGNPIGRWGSVAAANAMQFSSMPRHNPSGLILYPFRAYEPNLQRFTSPDPIGERGGINPYRFVYNNPLAFVDPDGLAPQLMSLSFDLNGGNASATYAYDKFGSDIRAAHAPLNESSLDYAEAAFAQVAQASYDPNSSGLDAAGSYLQGWALQF